MEPSPPQHDESEDADDLVGRVEGWGAWGEGGGGYRGRLWEEGSFGERVVVVGEETLL